MDLGQAFYFSIKNQCVFVFMLMRVACLKQWIPCIIRMSIFGAVLAEKKCVLYTGKYGSSKSINIILKTLSSVVDFICPVHENFN